MIRCRLFHKNDSQVKFVIYCHAADRNCCKSNFCQRWMFRLGRNGMRNILHQILWMQRLTCTWRCLFIFLQGLFEYVKPAWEKRVTPNVSDYDVKLFGSTLPSRPSPTSNVGEVPSMPKWVIFDSVISFFCQWYLIALFHFFVNGNTILLRSAIRKS